MSGMLSLASRIAARELRGGIKGFRVFIACLALGVAAIAGVGTLRAGIQSGLAEQGAVILGGDAEMRFTYRAADATELAFIDQISTAQSEVYDFRSMAVVEGDEALTQVKAVDAHWPLTGTATLDPALPVAEALAAKDGLPGAIMDPVLVERLNLHIGDSFRLGTQDFRLTAALIREPDSASAGFTLGPRIVVRTEDLAQSGLLTPGALFETRYRMLLPTGADLEALQSEAVAQFRDTGMRWTDSRNAAPGIETFVTRIGSFLVLVGLAGLAVGGVGIASAIRSYLDGKTGTIATLKTLGASGGLIFTSYLLQTALLSALGIALGLILGAAIPLIAAPLIEASLPFPAAISLSPQALLEAAFYGALSALIFTLIPLARTERLRPAALYRGATNQPLPRKRWLALLAFLIALMIGSATLGSGIAKLALGTAGGILAALATLALAALGLRWTARRIARSRLTQGRPALRAAIAAIGAPRGDTMAVVLSLGLGLSVLAAVGQIDWNLRRAIDTDLPTRAPAFFFVDIQPDQIGPFLDRMAANPEVTETETAPMLRGVITRINGKPAREVVGDHWVVRGDRGITYAANNGAKSRITQGEFWPEDYTGPPQISFGAEEAAEMGLKLGDEITTNILGRDIIATITSFREVDFSNAGIGFVMTMNPAALAGAPHTHIATVYAGPDAEAAILKDVTRTWPNITAIRIREAVDRVAEALSAIATATAWAAAGTLITGFIVLIGAAAAGERARIYEAAILRTLGATRGKILASFALRAGLLGAAAGVVAVIAGGVSGWAVMTFVMEGDYIFEPVSALAIVTGGVLATLLAGLAFAARPLSVRPAQVLRAQD
ncbi:FtsX-like permease family protein [Xinfangfangia sp. CPCC 101601]|uniref:FtsX-like permease family protein n=1 Tax=Pseudogemmobacter lacusdianii TaxID=3069608 RepID=A0ABU0VW80_9RHOB|nr:FtsX-like permease family protein [Xinfangfangia sp. CPCC 101601]MDQ2065958.1 FtsX-like permease family protein [Xinfangfangia sp. CPCC 101601]